MANVFDVILKTINDVQQKNQKSKQVETADPSIFDLIKNEVSKIDQKHQNNEVQKGRRSPKSILDMIKDGIEGAKKQNRKDPNVATAPGSVFDDILNKIEQKPQRQAVAGIKKIAQDYNLDISMLPAQMLNQIQNSYKNDVHRLDKEYATNMFKLLKQVRR